MLAGLSEEPKFVTKAFAVFHDMHSNERKSPFQIVSRDKLSLEMKMQASNIITYQPISMIYILQK